MVSSLVKNIKVSLIEFLEAFFISGATILLVFWLIGQPLEVTGDSMAPSYLSGEQLVSEKVSYKFSEPERGDVVIIRHPENKSVVAIKRLVGMPGEAIRISKGKVYIDGEELSEPYISVQNDTWGGTFLKENTVFEIPQGSYALLGDNRGVSMDSRAWGFVTKEDIIGRPVLVYFPISNFRLL